MVDVASAKCQVGVSACILLMMVQWWLTASNETSNQDISTIFNMPESSIWCSFSQVLSSDAISIVIRLNCHIWYMPRPSNDFNCQLPFGCLRHPLWRWAWSRRSGSHSSESFPGFLSALAITAPLAKFCFESCWFCSLLSQEGSAGGLSQLLI